MLYDHNIYCAVYNLLQTMNASTVTAHIQHKCVRSKLARKQKHFFIFQSKSRFGILKEKPTQSIKSTITKTEKQEILLITFERKKTCSGTRAYTHTQLTMPI